MHECGSVWRRQQRPRWQALRAPTSGSRASRRNRQSGHAQDGRRSEREREWRKEKSFSYRVGPYFPDVFQLLRVESRQWHNVLQFQRPINTPMGSSPRGSNSTIIHNSLRLASIWESLNTVKIPVRIPQPIRKNQPNILTNPVQYSITDWFDAQTGRDAIPAGRALASYKRHL